MESLHRRAPGRPGCIRAMCDPGRFICKYGFGHVESRIGQRFNRSNVFQRQISKQFQKPLHIGIIAVDPVLVVFIRRGQASIQPYGALFRFAHLVPQISGNQGKSNRLRVLCFNFADEFGPGQHIAPLIVPSHLQGTAVILEEIQKVVTLQDHVIELNEIQPLLHPHFIAFRRQHPVDAEMPPDITQEFNVIDFSQPVSIIEQ